MPDARKAAIRISGNETLKGEISDYLRRIELKTEEITPENSLEQMLSRRDSVDLVVTNDSTYVSRNAMLDSMLQFIYIVEGLFPKYPNVVCVSDYFAAMSVIP